MIIFGSAKGLLQLGNMKLALLAKSGVGGYEVTDDIALVPQRSDSETYIHISKAGFGHKGDKMGRP
jgi:hypothetical protein